MLSFKVVLKDLRNHWHPMTGSLNTQFVAASGIGALLLFFYMYMAMSGRCLHFMGFHPQGCHDIQNVLQHYNHSSKQQKLTCMDGLT